MNITIKLDESLLKDLLITAFEGGSNYWIDEVAKSQEATLCDSYDLFMEGKLTYLITPEELDSEPIELTLEKFKKGFEMMSEKHPNMFDRIIEEQYDAGDADVVLQYSLFNKTVFA